MSVLSWVRERYFLVEERFLLDFICEVETIDFEFHEEDVFFDLFVEEFEF